MKTGSKSTNSKRPKRFQRFGRFAAVELKPLRGS
jgi:hypothetical protein